jgi:phage gp45-like
MLSGSRAQQSKVIETMTGACRPYNLGGSATTLHQNDGLSVKMTNNGSAKDVEIDSQGIRAPNQVRFVYMAF